MGRERERRAEVIPCFNTFAMKLAVSSWRPFYSLTRSEGEMSSVCTVRHASEVESLHLVSSETI